MKKLAAVLLMAAMPVLATTIESGYRADSLTADQALILAQVVKQYGYVCSSISAASKSPWSGDFKLVCNNWNYVYHIKDVGGRIVVEVE